LRRSDPSIEIVVANSFESAKKELDVCPPGCEPLLVVANPCTVGMVSAVDVFRHMRSVPALQGVPFVVFTGETSKKHLESEKYAGMDAVVAKPLEYDEYLRCVSAIVRRYVKQPEREPSRKRMKADPMSSIDPVHVRWAELLLADNAHQVEFDFEVTDRDYALILKAALEAHGCKVEMDPIRPRLSVTCPEEIANAAKKRTPVQPFASSFEFERQSREA
jgi:DNA-binding response OmpR family regulator